MTSAEKVKKIPNVREQGYIPYFAGRSLAQNFYQTFNRVLKEIGEYKPANVINATLDYPNIKLKLSVPHTPNLHYIIFLCDGKHTVKDIISIVRKQNRNVTEGQLLDEIEQFYNCLHTSNLLLLRDKKAAYFQDHLFYQERFLQKFCTSNSVCDVI